MAKAFAAARIRPGARYFVQMSKRVQIIGFKGSTQEKSCSEIFRSRYGKASNDKKVPDRVGSGFSSDFSAAAGNKAGLR